MSNVKNTSQNLAQNSREIGIDALLLCAFVLSQKIKIKNFVELGMGNALASCTLALNLQSCQGFGIDIAPGALQVAKQTASKLTLEKRLQFALANVQDRQHVIKLYQEHMGNNFTQMVMTNPPYHKHGTGRTSKVEDRCIALHQDENTLEEFCATASRLLEHHGHFFCIYNPKFVADLFQALPAQKLGIRHLLAIHSFKQMPAQWILVHAQKNAQNDIKILPSLSLYHAKDQLSQEILNFCPWIG